MIKMLSKTLFIRPKNKKSCFLNFIFVFLCRKTKIEDIFSPYIFYV